MEADEIHIKELASRVNLPEEVILKHLSLVTKEGPLPDQENPFYQDLERCWVWFKWCTPGFYPSFRDSKSGKTYKGHRIAWALENGAIPEGFLICHRCDNPSCVNPGHLFLSTHLGNSQDKYSKGRGNPAKGDRNVSHLRPELRRGVGNGKSKLDDEKVREIRKRHAQGERTEALAIEFKLSRSAVFRVLSKQRWAHVE